MELLRQAANTCRLIVTRRHASEILLLPNGPGWIVPRAEIHPRERLAEQLAAASRACGVEAYCLLVPTAPPSNRYREPRCAVMESTQQDDKLPTGAFWAPCAAVASCIEASEAELIGKSIEELRAYSTNEKPGPFARPGCLRDLLRWAQKQVAPLGLRLTGCFRQLNASPTFSLVRLEAESGAVWFKATGQPNSQELPVTVALARLFPNHIPRLLGVHYAWNGWLSAEVTGGSLDQATDFSIWERVTEDLANLQIASIGKTAELIDARLKNFQVPRLAGQIDTFVARMGELMAAQEKPTPAPLTHSELTILAAGLKESCQLLESFGLPDTLGHLDLNPGNILPFEDRCVFLDWAEGCVTNPLLTFEYLCEHAVRSGMENVHARERLAAAYLRPWTSFYSPSDLTRALELSPLIAAFAYAVANDSWRSLDPVDNPELAGYFRSLTRRMYREAISVAQRNELCLD